MISAATREEQASACLAAAERFQPQLLAVAERLTGSREAGMDLFQQAALNCHDAIQAGGFEGDRYEFYLRRAIQNLHYRAGRSRTVAVDFQAAEHCHEAEDGGGEWGDEFFTRAAQPFAAAAPSEDEVSQLAEQMMSEARARFTPTERVILRLYIDGESSRDIALLVGLPNHLAVWRKLEAMKGHLRHTFRQAWALLTDPIY